MARAPWLLTLDARPAERNATGLWQHLQAMLSAESRQAPAIDSGGAPVQVWESLKTSLDVSQQRPCRDLDVVARALSDRSGPYYVLKNPHARTYMRLSPREYWLWERLNGTDTIQELVIAYFVTYGTFAFDLIAGLIQQLHQKQMLRQRPQLIYASVNKALARRTLAYRLTRPFQILFAQELTLNNLDGFMTGLYRRVGWILYTRPAQLLWLIVSVLGLFLFTRILGDARFQLIGENVGASVATFWLATVPLVIVHELGHALTAKHYGCEIHRGGLMLYFGAPAAFVDTTDIWMKDKRARLAVTWAGPYTGFISGGLCTLIIWLWPELALSPFLFQMAAIGIALSILNMNPLLKLDGYYLLADSLEIDRLRERSLAFMRHTLLSKLLKRERFSAEELFFVVFAVLAFIWTSYVIYASLLLWGGTLARSAQAILNSRGDPATFVVNGFLILLAGLCLMWIGVRVYQFGRSVLAHMYVARWTMSRRLSSIVYRRNPERNCDRLR